MSDHDPDPDAPDYGEPDQDPKDSGWAVVTTAPGPAGPVPGAVVVGLRITTAHAPGPIAPIDPFDLAELAVLLDRPAPLLLDRGALEVIDRLEREPRDRDRTGPGRSPEERAGLLAYLRAAALEGRPIRVNAIHLERQGGRAYAFAIPRYAGPTLISVRQYSAHRGERHLLAAMPRELRALLRAPAHQALTSYDYSSAHPRMAYALSGDPLLGEDLERDVHQLTGDRLAPQLEPWQRREIGKAVNNSMLFGLSPEGLGRDLARRGLRLDARAAHAAWWQRYPQLEALRLDLQHRVALAQHLAVPLEVLSPSGRVSRFSAAEVRGWRKVGPVAPDESWRSIWAAIFRAVEGDLLLELLRRLRRKAPEARLALPIYDGLIVSVPTADAVVTHKALIDSGRAALEALGAARAPQRHPGHREAVPGWRTTADPSTYTF